LYVITSLVFSTDGKYIVYALRNNTLNFLDVETGQKVREIDGGESCTGRGFNNAILADANQYYTVGTDYVRPPDRHKSELAVWNSNANSCELITLTLGWPVSLELNHNGFLLLNLAFVGVEDQDEIQVWDTRTNQQTCVITTSDGDDWIRGLLHPDRNEMIVFSPDGRAVWDVTTCEVIEVISNTDDGRIEAFDPTGNRYVTYADGTLTFWDAHTHALLSQMDDLPDSNYLMELRFDPGGSYLLAVFGGSPDALVVWQLEP
jgi:WD40 repeat protein